MDASTPARGVDAQKQYWPTALPRTDPSTVLENVSFLHVPLPGLMLLAA